MKSIHIRARGWRWYCSLERRASMENKINKTYEQTVVENREVPRDLLVGSAVARAKAWQRGRWGKSWALTWAPGTRGRTGGVYGRNSAGRNPGGCPARAQGSACAAAPVGDFPATPPGSLAPTLLSSLGPAGVRAEQNLCATGVSSVWSGGLQLKALMRCWGECSFL